MTHKIEFKKLGQSFGTRFQGEIIRKTIIENLKANHNIIFDFEGVQIISQSFADECFGKLLLDYNLNEIKAATSFQNTSTLISTVIRYALVERFKKLSI